MIVCKLLDLNLVELRKQQALGQEWENYLDQEIKKRKQIKKA